MAALKNSPPRCWPDGPIHTKAREHHSRAFCCNEPVGLAEKSALNRTASRLQVEMRASVFGFRGHRTAAEIACYAQSRLPAWPLEPPQGGLNLAKPADSSAGRQMR